MTIQVWQDLIRQLELINVDSGNPSMHSANSTYEIEPKREFMTVEECEDVEKERGIIFPKAYKEFCQVFGTGCFGNDCIEIQCPTRYWLDHVNVARQKGIANSIKLSNNEIVINNKEEIMSLLSSATFFGGLDYFGVFWDLRTYSQEDDSYDIYWALISCEEGDIFRVGRNFVEFIQNFCLGQGMLELLPIYFHDAVDNVSPTFTRYPRISMARPFDFFSPT